MSRRFLPLALISLGLLSTSCANFAWGGRGVGVTEDQRARGIQSVAQLEDAYENEVYWRGVRSRWSGRWAAFERDLASIRDTFDRHFLNYSRDDPYLPR